MDCSITNNKITIGNKTKIFNDETKRLLEVKLVNPIKNPCLEFKGIEQKENKPESKFSYMIIVPKDELYKAERVVNFLKNNTT